MPPASLTVTSIITNKPSLGSPALKSFTYWPIAANWESKVVEEVAYRTEVIVSRDGTEQRIAQRVNPRYTFRFGVRVAHSDAALLERLLAKRQAYDYSFPHPRSAILTDRGHPAASGFVGRFESELAVAARTDRVLDLDVAVAVNPGVYVRDYLVGYEHPAPEQTHNGLELMTLRPNWADPVRLNFGQYTEILDKLRGPSDFFSPRRYTARMLQIGIMIRGEDEENRLRGLFERMRGQQGEFYVADPLSGQVVPNADISSGATSLTVAGRTLFDRFESEAIYRNIAIRTKTGYIYRRVTSISLISGNSRLNLSSSLPQILLSDVIGVQWLLRVRFASDTLVLTWETDKIARTTLSLRAMEDL